MTAISSLLEDAIDEAAYGTVQGGYVGNSSAQARRVLSIANRIASEIHETYSWRELWKTASITLVSGVSEYSLPNDFSYYHYETFWNRGETLPMYQLSPGDLAYLEGYGITGLTNSGFYIRGIKTNKFNIYPTPDSSGDVVAFEYVSARPFRPRTWAASLSVTSGDYIFYDGNYYTSGTTGNTGATPPTHITGTVSDGAVNWTYYDGAYKKIVKDTDEFNLNERIFSQGVLERLAVISGQNVRPLFDLQLAAEFSRQAPASVIDVAGQGNPAFLYGRNGKALFTTGV